MSTRAKARAELVHFSFGIPNPYTQLAASVVSAKPLRDIEPRFKEHRSVATLLGAGGKLKTPDVCSLALGKQRVISNPTAGPGSAPRLQDTGYVAANRFQSLAAKRRGPEPDGKLSLELSPGDLQQGLLTVGPQPAGNDFYAIEIEQTLDDGSNGRVKGHMIVIVPGARTSV